MKYKFQLLLFIAILAGTFWTACDKIEDPAISIQNFTNDKLDTLFYVDSVMVNVKQVYLEDFTGQRCPNCAEAAVTAHQWAEDLDHKLVICAIHAGYYAEPQATGHYTRDYRCAAGDAIFNYYSILGWPAGTINRVEYNGNTVLSLGEWDDALEIELAKDNVVNMKVINTFYPNINTVGVNVISEFNQQLDGKYKLVVLIVEDGIVSPQQNNNPAIGPSPDWLDYTHRNLLRDNVSNTVEGEYISSNGSITTGVTYSNNFTYQINEAWLTDSTECNIISFIYQEESSAIIQVAELGIKKEE